LVAAGLGSVHYRRMLQPACWLQARVHTTLAAFDPGVQV
jgi:hypothetical protein